MGRWHVATVTPRWVASPSQATPQHSVMLVHQLASSLLYSCVGISTVGGNCLTREHSACLCQGSNTDHLICSPARVIFTRQP